MKKPELKDITMEQLKEFWASLDSELDGLGTRNMYDILNSAVYIKGVWDDGKLAAIGGLCGVFLDTVVTTFHVIHRNHQGKGFTHIINHSYIEYAKSDKRAIIINSIDLGNDIMERSILKDGFRHFYQSSTQRWYYLAFNWRGRLMARLLPLAIRTYLSPLMCPLRILRNLTKRYRNVLAQRGFKQSLVMVMVYLLCKPLTPFEYLRFLVAGHGKLGQRWQILRRFRYIHRHIECLHTEGELLRLADYILSRGGVGQGTYGDIVECGTFNGGATCKLSVVAKLTGRQVIACDSFEGLPTPTVGEGKDFTKGDYLTPLDVYRSNIVRYGEPECIVTLSGWFNETLHAFGSPIILIFEDADIYESVRTCLDNLWGKLQWGCRMYTHEMLFPEALEAYKEMGLRVKGVGIWGRLSTHNLGYVEK